MSLKLEIDVAEPRTLLDRLVASADGTTWDKRLGSGFYIDPVTKTLMLQPLPTTPAWSTTFTGDYSRFGKADYDLITPAAWAENNRRGSGDIYLEGFGAAGEVVTTADTWGVNCPMFISLFVPGIGTDKQVILECGWGEPGVDGTVSLRLHSDGNCAVYKGATLLAFHDLEGISSLTGGSGEDRTKKLANVTLDLMLIPCRRREMLVLSNWGAGFSHCFEDLDPEIVNTITPDAKFFWRVPAGKPSVQLCPLSYVTEGVAYSNLVTFRYTPTSGQAFTPDAATDNDGTGGTAAATFGLVNSTLGTYAPGFDTNQARIKATLTGDGNSALWVYAVDVYTERTLTATNGDHAFDLSSSVMKMSLAVPENEAATMSVTVKEPAALAADGLSSPASVGDRPLRLSLPTPDGTGRIDVFRGTTDRPRHPAMRLDALETLEWAAMDRERQFGLYSFRDTRPYDGHGLTYTVTDLVKLGGFADTDADVTSDTFLLPYSPGVSLGDFQLLQERGDNIAGWIQKLHRDYAATWITGWAPTATGVKYRFRDPASFSATPVLTIYEDRADAIAAGVPAAQCARFTVRSLTERPEPPECNQIIVIGYDRRTRKYITSQYDDAASQDPTTAPAMRPANWRGQVVTYQLIEPLISTQAAADRARGILRDRMTVGREVAEFTSDFLIVPSSGVPVWKGDTVRIIKKGGTPRGDYRILSLGCEFESETLPDMPVRTATYTAQKIGTGG